MMTFPIALIHKTIFSHAESFLKEKFDLLNSEVDVLASLYTHNMVKKSLNEISKECSKYFEAFNDEERELFSALLKKILLNINRF